MTTAKEEIAKFYKNKMKYDSKYNTAKNRILHDSELSKEDKQNELKKVKPRCMGCKRSVGTIFIPTIGRVKEAKCGDTKDPCSYHIIIGYGTYNYAPNLLDKINHDIRLFQFGINKIKYNLLFGLVTEEDMEDSFNETKEKYKQMISYKKMVEDFLDKFNKVDVEGINGLQKEVIDKKIFVQTKKNELEALISEFRTIISNYTSGNTGDVKKAFMTDAIDLYLNRIMPIMKIIRETLYEITTVLKEKGQFKLIQKQHTLQSLVMEFDPMTFKDNVIDEGDEEDVDDEDDEEDDY